MSKFWGPGIEPGLQGDVPAPYLLTMATKVPGCTGGYQNKMARCDWN